MEWLGIIGALLAGLVIGYWLARRAFEDEHRAAAAIAARVERMADEPPPASTNHRGESTDPATQPADDLRKIEGIGPKIAELMHQAGIGTFAQMASSSTDRLGEVLAAAGDRYRVHDPSTWPMQAELAAAGQWDALRELQERLDGGRTGEPTP